VQSAAVDAFGHTRLGGIGQFVADEIEKRARFETRVTVLGHIQRGGTPTMIRVREVTLSPTGDERGLFEVAGREFAPLLDWGQPTDGVEQRAAARMQAVAA
jgi:hypothetical protein